MGKTIKLLSAKSVMCRLSIHDYLVIMERKREEWLSPTEGLVPMLSVSMHCV